jgi:hypothetical protein
VSPGRRLALRASVVLCTALLGATQAQAQGNEPAPDAAQQLPRRKATFSISGDWVAFTVAWRDVVDAKIRNQLRSGLPTVIASRAYVFPSAAAEPVALSIKTCRIVFDLWDEVFRIELRQGGQRRETVAVNIEGVLRRCAEASNMPLLPLRDLKPAERYFVGVLVEVNPISKEMLDRIKRWVSLPKGAGAVGPSDSLFGSFVGLFVAQVPAADRTVAFRTLTFALADLPKPEPKPEPK